MHKVVINTTPQPRPAAILGNGPSMRDFDFKKELDGFDTFGMNVAYRYWDRINWYPDYYSCLDTVVGISHKFEIKRLIDQADKYAIKSFLLRDNLIQELGLHDHPIVFNFEVLRNQYHLIMGDLNTTTGGHTCAWAAALGYETIILLGIDSNYINHIQEAASVEGKPIVLEITSTPKNNPNYFFDDYQQAGDRYHVPNPRPEQAIHRVCWENLQKRLSFTNSVVVNGNPNSMVDIFPKTTFSNALILAEGLKKNKNIVRSRLPIVGPFTRQDNINLDENSLLGAFLPKTDGVMIDVGAHQGGSCIPFLQKEWQVYAFEPDTRNRKILLERANKNKNLHLDARAVFSSSEKTLNWFTSPESTDISGLLDFHPSHTPAGMVTTVSLADFCDEQNINTVDYLKVDTEGLGLIVLSGFPFDKIKPACILCEFENIKSIHIGYTAEDMANFLLNLGYHIYVSEWHPILRYGIKHHWHKLTKYPCGINPLGWGEIFAFHQDPGEQLIKLATLTHIKLLLEG